MQKWLPVNVYGHKLPGQHIEQLNTILSLLGNMVLIENRIVKESTPGQLVLATHRSAPGLIHKAGQKVQRLRPADTDARLLVLPKCNGKTFRKNAELTESHHVCALA